MESWRASWGSFGRRRRRAAGPRAGRQGRHRGRRASARFGRLGQRQAGRAGIEKGAVRCADGAPGHGVGGAREQGAFALPVESRSSSSSPRCDCAPDAVDRLLVEPGPACGRMRPQHQRRKLLRRAARRATRRRAAARRRRHGLRSTARRAAPRRAGRAVRAAGAKPCRKSAKPLAVVQQPAVARRLGRHVQRRRGAEPVAAHQPRHGREVGLAARRCSPSSRCCDRPRRPGCATSCRTAGSGASCGANRALAKASWKLRRVCVMPASSAARAARACACIALGHQLVEGRHIAVALDQRGPRRRCARSSAR